MGWLFLETIWSLSGTFSFVHLTEGRNGRLDDCYFNFHFTQLAANGHVTFLRSVRIRWRHFAGTVNFQEFQKFLKQKFS
jgi:hypothetical protein